MPGRAPIGYFNDIFGNKGEKTIKPDPNRFNLVRKMWELLLDKHYSIERIHELAVEKWNLTLYTSKKPCRSKIYQVFTNPFYYGHFFHAGVLYPGKHEPMITKQEFDKAQDIINNRLKPQAIRHSFAFTGLIRCGECNSMITAEEHTKHQNNGNSHHYTYYRCSRSKNKKCPQKFTEVRDLLKNR